MVGAAGKSALATKKSFAKSAVTVTACCGTNLVYIVCSESLTESQRVHIPASTVAIMTVPDEVEVNIDQKDSH